MSRPSKKLAPASKNNYLISADDITATHKKWRQISIASYNFASPIDNGTAAPYNLTITDGELTKDLAAGVDGSGCNNILTINGGVNLGKGKSFFIIGWMSALGSLWQKKKKAQTIFVAGGIENNTNTEELSGNKVYVGYDKKVNGDIISSKTAINLEGTAFIHGAWSHANSVVSKNEVHIGPAVLTRAIGGLSDKGDAIGNIVTLNGGKITRGVTGGYSIYGTAVDNSVTINYGKIRHDVVGGYSQKDGKSSGNNVLINGQTTIDGTVSGGRSKIGTVEANGVSITDGIMMGSIYGGRSAGGNANNNTVALGSGKVKSNILGGSSNNNSATGNKVIISGGSSGHTVHSIVSGGSVDSGFGAASLNEVTIAGGMIAGGIKGGISYHGNVAENIVSISGGKVTADIVGGFSYDGDMTDNSVNITGGVVAEVYGANSSAGVAHNNSVTIDGGMAGEVYGAHSMTGTVNNNSVTILRGTAGEIYGGASSEANASFNEVIISGGSLQGGINGGLSINGVVSNNSVNITGGLIENKRAIRGGSSVVAMASNNSVMMSGGIVTGFIIGGSSVDSHATGNSVMVNGGAVTGAIIGGSSVDANATDNVVTIGEMVNGIPVDLDLTKVSDLRGGTTDGSGDIRTRNSLTIARNIILSSTPVSTVENFEVYNFIITNAHNYNRAFLEANTIVLGDKTKISVSSLGGIAPRVGQEILLLKAKTRLIGTVIANTSRIILRGEHYLLEIELPLGALSGIELKAKVIAIKSSSLSQKLSEMPSIY